MFGQGDYAREDQENLRKLDNMVTVAKTALEKIVEVTSVSGQIVHGKVLFVIDEKTKLPDKVPYIQGIALAALLKIERLGK